MSAKLRDAMEWLLLVAMVLGGGAIAQAQNDAAATDQRPTGKIVRIGPAGDSQISLDGATIEGEDGAPMGQPALPSYWIGVLGGPVSEELRAQIDISPDQGVLIRHVVSGSPADKAGLRPFDILLEANGDPLADVQQLSKLVQTEGESGGKISLDVLRRGERQAMELEPEARSESAGVGGGRMNTFGRPGGQAWNVNPRDPASFGFRGMPGVRPMMGGFNLSQMPNGVSVSIQKQNDEPAHIVVKRGNDTWDIVGDDPSALAELPEDVRPFVEGLLANDGMSRMSAMPMMPAMPLPPAGFRNGELQQRLDLMQQQLEELQQRMHEQVEAMQTEETDASVPH